MSGFHLILLFIRGWNKRHIIPARSLISLIKIVLAGIIRPVVPGLRYANIMNQLSIIGNGLFIIFIAFIFLLIVNAIKAIIIAANKNTMTKEQNI